MAPIGMILSRTRRAEPVPALSWLLLTYVAIVLEDRRAVIG
jgi:hypothetical protein